MASIEILVNELSRLKAEVKRLKDQAWRAEVAGGFIRRTRTELYDTTYAPLVDRWKNGMVAFCTDGRKSGEGVGAGTGCYVGFDTASVKWLRLADELEVQV